MKPETTWAGQRKTMSWGGKKSTDRPWIFFLFFCCNSSMLVRWFRLYRFTSGVKPLFEAHSQNVASKFSSILTFSWLVFNSRLYFFTSGCKLTFKHESPAYFSLVLEEGSYPSPLVIPAQKIWDIWIFLIIFNYRSHSPVTGWPTTSALASVTQW